MPTPAVIPRRPFIPRTAGPPYSHVENSTRAELVRLGLTALRAMVDVEPYVSSDLGGDPSDDERPSMTSASPLEDDHPEDPENPSGWKKKKKRKTKPPEGRRSQEAKAIATSEIVVNLPEVTGKELSEFTETFGRFLRMTSQTRASGRVKCDLLLQCCKTKYLEKQVKQIVTKSATFAEVLVALERQYPTYKTDLSIRVEIQILAVLPNNPKPAKISELLADLDHSVGRLTPRSYGIDELLFWLVAKLPRELWDECRSTAECKARVLNYEDLSVLPLELALEKESDQHLNAYRPGGGGSGSHGHGYQGHRPGQGTTPKNARMRAMYKISCGLMPETSRAPCFTGTKRTQAPDGGKKAYQRALAHITIHSATHLPKDFGTERHIVLEGQAHHIITATLYTLAAHERHWDPTTIPAMPPPPQGPKDPIRPFHIDQLLSCRATPNLGPFQDRTSHRIVGHPGHDPQQPATHILKADAQ